MESEDKKWKAAKKEKYLTILDSDNNLAFENNDPYIFIKSPYAPPPPGPPSAHSKWSKMMNLVKLKDKFQSIRNNMGYLNRLLKYTTRSKLLLFFANIALLSTSVIQSTMPFICGEILDSVIKRNDMNEMMEHAKRFCLLAVSYSVSEFFWAYLFNVISNQISYTIRKEVYYNILIKDMSYFNIHEKGELITRLFDDIGIVQHICTTNFSSITRNIIQLLYSCGLVISLSKKLTLYLILIVPGYVIINGIYSLVSRKLGMRSNEYEIKAKSRSAECFMNIKVIKAFSTEEQEYGIFKNYIKQSLKISKKHSIAWSTYVASIGFATNMALLMILYIGVSMIALGDISAGYLSSFLLYTIAIVNSFQDLSTNCTRVISNLPIAANLFKIIDDKPNIHPAISFDSLKSIEYDENMLTMRSNSYNDSNIILTPLGQISSHLTHSFPGHRSRSLLGDIKIINLTFSYPTKSDVLALKNINIHIKPGEIVALVGASGSGKSTLVSLIQRFYDPLDSGKILIDDIDLREYDLKWLHQQIGFVSQEPALMSGTILDNITYGVESYTSEKLNQVIKMAHLNFIYNNALFPEGLQTQVGEGGGKLSGGQKQRIAIARAMMKNPRIVIFDEATSALDAESEFQVQKAIDNLVKGSEHTMLIIAHRLSTILDCQRILVFEDGILKEDGNHEELIRKDGLYKSLFKRQLEGYKSFK